MISRPQYIALNPDFLQVGRCVSPYVITLHCRHCCGGAEEHIKSMDDREKIKAKRCMCHDSDFLDGKN